MNEESSCNQPPVVVDDVLPAKKESSKKKKKAKRVYVYYYLHKLAKEQITLDDFFNELNLLFVNISEKKIGFSQMSLLTEQFKEGVAQHICVPLQTFKAAVCALDKVRSEIDIRIMKNFWPLFHQIFLHLGIEDLNEAIEHFYSVESLWDSRGTEKVLSMVDSFEHYQSEFEKARYFLLYGKLGAIDDNIKRKCKELCFFLVLTKNGQRGVKELTLAAMGNAARNNNYAIDNLVKFLHVIPILILFEISRKERTENGEEKMFKEHLAVGLARHIQELLRSDFSDLLSRLRMEERLRRLIEGITSGSELNENEVSEPLLEAHLFGPLLSSLGRMGADG